MTLSDRSNSETARENRKALALFGFSLGSYALFYTTNILLARTLNVRDFDDYNVAVSTVLFFAAVATLGLEKFALRCLPTMQYNQDWSASRGFMLSSSRLIIGGSLAITVLLAVSLEATLILRGRDYHLAIVIVSLFLPVIAMFQFVLEVVTAYGGQLKAVAIYRLLFPALLLILNILVWTSPLTINAITAALCYGGAWIVAFAVLRILAHRQVPSPVWQAKPTQQTKAWIHGAMPLVANSILLTAIASTGVIVLELNHPNQVVVSAYAIAFQTGTFVVILATATNRLYLPRISQLIVSKDYRALRMMARRRLALMAPLILIYLILIAVFGRFLLALFGLEFVSAYPALFIIAAGASFSTLFSLSPIWLHYADRSRVTLAATTACVLFSLAMCFPLSYYYGSLGAAVAYSIPIAILYFGLRLYASKVFREMEKES